MTGAVEPGDRPLDHPPVTPRPLTTFDAAAGDAQRDAAPAQPFSQRPVVGGLQQQSVLRKDKADRLRLVIREAAEQIVAAGLYVSEARVKDYAKHRLPNLGRGSLFKQALREIKLEMGLTSQ